MKTCERHGIEKRRAGRGWLCRKCDNEYQREYRKSHPRPPSYFKSYRDNEKRKKYMQDFILRKSYGITVEQKNSMLASQGGRCAICLTDQPGGKGVFAVDHDHASGEVRGILCHGCNTGLGGFRDSPSALIAAIGYLPSERFSEGGGI